MRAAGSDEPSQGVLSYQAFRPLNLLRAVVTIGRARFR